MALSTGQDGIDFRQIDYLLETKTDIQIAIIAHAASVNSERSENQRLRDRICDYCQKPNVSQDAYGRQVCGEKGCGREQVNRKSKKKQQSRDVLNYAGLRFEGDKFESAATKFKRHCVKNNQMGLYKAYWEGLRM